MQHKLITWGALDERDANHKYTMSDEALRAIGLRRPTKKEGRVFDGPGLYLLEYDIIIKGYGLTKLDGTNLDLTDIKHARYRDGGSTEIKICKNAKENWKKILNALGVEEKNFTQKSFAPDTFAIFSEPRKGTEFDPNGRILFPSKEVREGDFPHAIVSTIGNDVFLDKAMELFNQKLTARDPQIFIIPPLSAEFIEEDSSSINERKNKQNLTTTISSAVTPSVFTQVEKDRRNQNFADFIVQSITEKLEKLPLEQKKRMGKSDMFCRSLKSFVKKSMENSEWEKLPANEIMYNDLLKNKGGEEAFYQVFPDMIRAYNHDNLTPFNKFCEELKLKSITSTNIDMPNNTNALVNS